MWRSVLQVLATVTLPLFVGLVIWRLRAQPIRHAIARQVDAHGTFGLFYTYDYDFMGIPFFISLTVIATAPLLFTILLIQEYRASK